MKWYHGLEIKVEQRKPLADHTWYRLGGAAKYFCTPRTVEHICQIVRRARAAELPVKVLGVGANVLIRDEGFDGIVVKLDPCHFGYVQFTANGLTAGAAADLPDVIRRSVNQGLAGLEPLAGIPGSIGGAVRMNAGGRFGEIGDVVASVRVVDAEGRLRQLSRNQIGFAYRRTALAPAIVVDAHFDLTPTNPALLQQRYREIWDYKKKTQPFTRNNAGCMFKNPTGKAAGELIDRAGFKGQRVGGASVSEQHANFIIAQPGARTADILTLAEQIRSSVRERYNVELEYEIDVW